LAVNIGSFAEEEGERGVAHIVEHLAFSATKKYSNHDIVKFLESIGAESGPCQNAYTSTGEKPCGMPAQGSILLYASTGQTFLYTSTGENPGVCQHR